MIKIVHVRIMTSGASGLIPADGSYIAKIPEKYTMRYSQDVIGFIIPLSSYSYDDMKIESVICESNIIRLGYWIQQRVPIKIFVLNTLYFAAN